MAYFVVYQALDRFAALASREGPAPQDWGLLGKGGGGNPPKKVSASQTLAFAGVASAPAQASFGPLPAFELDRVLRFAGETEATQWLGSVRDADWPGPGLVFGFQHDPQEPATIVALHLWAPAPPPPAEIVCSRCPPKRRASWVPVAAVQGHPPLLSDPVDTLLLRFGDETEAEHWLASDAARPYAGALCTVLVF